MSSTHVLRTVGAIVGVVVLASPLLGQGPSSAMAPAKVVSVEAYYTNGHPGVEEPHYHFVLWHLARHHMAAGAVDEARALAHQALRLAQSVRNLQATNIVGSDPHLRTSPAGATTAMGRPAASYVPTVSRRNGEQTS